MILRNICKRPYAKEEKQNFRNLKIDRWIYIYIYLKIKKTQINSLKHTSDIMIQITHYNIIIQIKHCTLECDFKLCQHRHGKVSVSSIFRPCPTDPKRIQQNVRAHTHIRRHIGRHPARQTRTLSHTHMRQHLGRHPARLPPAICEPSPKHTSKDTSNNTLPQNESTKSANPHPYT